MEREDGKVTTIQVTCKTQRRIISYKEHPNQPYEHIINRIIDEIERLTDENIRYRRVIK